ncbi:LuxR C-terminal-related transcriptional regulator [Devosia sp.]|uniref:LuxR C-terminal-related transcriptional regulator n=1 Tax=Devosia sp. TaxID=1871048 RepID=UPI001AD5FE22|nr:LuxR C-terminal-related transcriptional regulator [Devosia sp.]MBN9332626.1 hypothetical protein [Devosia sp.]
MPVPKPLLDAPPVQLFNPVVRKGLEAALLETDATTTLLVGPPGSGKTVALSALWTRIRDAGDKAAWLELTPEDNDLKTLKARLGAAMDSAGTVFVDGLNHLATPHARYHLDHLLFEAPRRRFYAASRALPGPGFQQGFLRGAVNVVGPQELRLDDSEARQVLGIRLSRRQAEHLNRFVDGWAAGLRMLSMDADAALALADDKAGATAIPAAMAAYFDSVICADLPAGTLQALFDISVFRRFSPESLTAIPPGGRRWADIAPLIEHHLFVRHVDATRVWASFQPAFGCHLRHRFRQADPGRYEQLRMAAAAWFEAEGHATEAVRHAVALADGSTAARIVENAGAISIDAGDGPDVALGAPIAPERAVELPLAFLGQVYYRIRQGRQREVRAPFERAAALTDNFTRLGANADPEVVSSWYALLVVVLKAADDVELAEADIDRLEAALAAQMAREPVLAASIASVLAFLYLDLSRHAEAAAICSMGMSALDVASNYKATLFIRLHQAAAALAQDTLEQAVLCVEDAMRIASIEGSSASYEMVTSQILRGVLHYENNELKQALALLQPALGYLHAVNGWGRLYAEAFTIAADAASLLHGPEVAEKLIRAGEGFARQRNLQRLGNHLAIARLAKHLRAGDWRAAQSLVDEAPLADLLTSRELSPYLLVQQVPAQLKAAELLLAIGRPRQAQAMLDQINKSFLADADNRLRLGFHVLAMQAAFGARRFNAAVEHMHASVELARQSGLVRRILDAREAVLAVFDWALRNGRHPAPGLATYVKSVLRPGGGAASGTQLAQNRPRRGAQNLADNFALSPRESEIIALIAEGFSAKEIASRLEISEGTVKSHRKKIHEKLGVTTRSQAIQRARELLIV